MTCVSNSMVVEATVLNVDEIYISNVLSSISN
jgi:hypothetical protein